MSSDAPHDIRLGEILLKLGLVTQEQIDQALLLQKAQDSYRPIGEILRDSGLFSRTALRNVLLRHRKRMLLGKLLLRMGAISEDSLNAGLSFQERRPEKLGKILLRESIITQPVLADALSIQLTIPAIKPELRIFDRTLLKDLNGNFLYKKQVVPVARNTREDALTVIMDDPLDLDTVMTLEKMFNGKIEPAVLVYGEIDRISTPSSIRGPRPYQASSPRTLLRVRGAPGKSGKDYFSLGGLMTRFLKPLISNSFSYFSTNGCSLVR